MNLENGDVCPICLSEVDKQLDLFDHCNGKRNFHFYSSLANLSNLWGQVGPEEENLRKIEEILPVTPECKNPHETLSILKSQITDLVRPIVDEVSLAEKFNNLSLRGIRKNTVGNWLIQQHPAFFKMIGDTTFPVDMDSIKMKPGKEASNILQIPPLEVLNSALYTIYKNFSHKFWYLCLCKELGADLSSIFESAKNLRNIIRVRHKKAAIACEKFKEFANSTYKIRWDLNAAKLLRALIRKNYDGRSLFSHEFERLATLMMNDPREVTYDDCKRMAKLMRKRFSEAFESQNTLYHNALCFINEKLLPSDA